MVESGDPNSCHLSFPLSFRGSPQVFWTLGSFSLKWRCGTCPKALMSEMLGLSVLFIEHVVQSVLAGGIETERRVLHTSAHRGVQQESVSVKRLCTF